MSELYELPDGWEILTLNEMIEKEIILSHLDGNHGSFYPKKNEFVDNGIYYLSANCIENNNLVLKNAKFLTEKRALQLTKGIAKNDDVLFAHNATVGPVAILKTKEEFVILSTSLTYYRCNKDVLLPKYLYYYFQSHHFISQYKSVMGQATRNQVPITKQRSFFHLIPPLSEQQRIVSKLDLLFEKIDKSIALHQKNMDEANVFMGSVLNDVFGELEEKYGLTKINDVVVKTNNVNPMNDLDKPFTYIDISSIDNKSFQIVDPKQLIGKEAPSRAKKEVVLGDIVYSTTRPNLKNISIVNKEYDNPIASTGFCVLRVNENTINSYLFYYVITDKLFEQIEPNIRGAQYPATSDKDLKNCNIPNTPLNIQKKIVKYLDEISQKMEKIKQIQKEKMQSLKALKASILDQAFKGEL